MSSAPSLAQRVVVIGAGIVGANVADELLSRGWTTITVVEQGPLVLPGGSTSHAPGLVFQTNSSKSMTQCASYTVEKMLSLQKDGENCFDQVGGLEVATTPERLEDLKRKHGWASSWGIEAHLVTPSECIELYPLLKQEAVLGGLHTPTDGLAKASRAVQLLIDRTSKGGVRWLGSTPVTGIQKKDRQILGLHTPQGTIPADIVISCAGFWGAEIGAMIGFPMPLIPLAHQYAKTASVPALAERKALSNATMMPILRHQDRDLYYREHGDQYGIGYYGHRPMPADAGSLGFTSRHIDDKTQPSRLDFTTEDFIPAWTESQTLLPSLEKSEIAEGFNGIFSFTPDGAPLVGQAPNLDGFYVAQAVWVTHSAGVARAVAQMLTTGQSDVDMNEFQLSRFEKIQLSSEYVSETSQQSFVEVYDIIHPWQPRSSPRNLRVSPFHSSQQKLGAFFVDAKAWERAEWYQSNLALTDQLPPSWRHVERDEWSGRFYSPAAVVEAWKARTAVAMFDLTSTSRVRVSGPGSFDLLQLLCTGEVPREPGIVIYTLLLSWNGCVRGDATIARLGHDLFQLTVSSSIDIEYIRREALHQSQRYPREWVQVHEISSGTCCIGLWGPMAQEVVKNAGYAGLDDDPQLSSRCREATIAGIPVLAIRISDIGERGWELHASADSGQRLWDVLWLAGQCVGIVAAGRIAHVSLRLEKGYRAFGTDFTTEHDPFEADVEFAVDSNKRAFIGWEALQKRSQHRPARRLRCLSVCDGCSVVMGKEPVLNNGKVVGYVASAAFGYSIGKPIAHAWLPDCINEGDLVEVEYFGRSIEASVMAKSCGNQLDRIK